MYSVEVLLCFSILYLILLDTFFYILSAASGRLLLKVIKCIALIKCNLTSL